MWKDGDRAVIPKAGKDDYHDCGSYRTVSITSSLGKRFEYITLRRLIAVLEDSNLIRYSLPTYRIAVLLPRLLVEPWRLRELTQM